jgi:hypothetical protein
VQIGAIHGEASRHLRNPGIAWRANHLAHSRRLRQSPRDGVFPSTRTNHQNLHRFRNHPCRMVRQPSSPTALVIPGRQRAGSAVSARSCTAPNMSDQRERTQLIAPPGRPPVWLIPDGEALPPVLRLLQLIHQRDGVVLHRDRALAIGRCQQLILPQAKFACPLTRLKKRRGA